MYQIISKTLLYLDNDYYAIKNILNYAIPFLYFFFLNYLGSPIFSSKKKINCPIYILKYIRESLILAYMIDLPVN